MVVSLNNIDRLIEKMNLITNVGSRFYYKINQLRNQFW